MSRPIKFRVWDVRKQAYTERCNDKLVFCTSAGSGDLGKYEAIVADLYDPTTQCMEQVPVYYNGYQLILEQFTGLLDSKGVEIYEGDILHTFSGEDVYAEVYWEHGDPSFDGFSGARWAYRLSPLGNIGYLSPYRAKGWKVAGNIHQHPELLKT